ncbi:hypothetical protein ElyMa_002838400 [Elysia marginata]|uniref:PKD domain-containing protein n=1 Tax=Elysia marginata TaxID=1093978 RepID=A0AAV4HWU7_9GAST|nr:hypothetical protein ElyMa_002838400 [Elysia marginata]
MAQRTNATVSVLIVIFFLCLADHWCVAQQTTTPPDRLVFSYTEGDQELFLSSHSPSGCYQDLNSYPHWCLGNLSRCDQGISVIAQIHLNSAVPPGHPAEVLLTSGGHNPNGDGFFISRALSDQYTVGVAKGDNTWSSTLRLVSGPLLVSLGLTWEESSGLKVYVDGLHMKTVASPTKRVSNPDYDGSSSSLAVGVSELGYPLTQACSYSVRQLEVTNKVLGLEGFRTGYNISEEMYLGCVENSTDLTADFYVDVRPNKDISPSTQCRLDCNGIGKTYALMRGAVLCACRDHIEASAVSTSACHAKWDVFYVSSVTQTHSYALALDSKSQSSNSYTKPGEDFLFFASLGLSNVEVIYRFDFDDGVTVITTSPPVSHSWLLDGGHSVNVTAKLGLVVISGEVQVMVEDVDEGQPPSVVGLTVGHDAKQALMARASLRTFEERKVQCTLYYGDDDVSDSFSIDVFGGVVDKYHNYSACGQYKVQASCSNAYGNTNASSVFYAKELVPKYTILSSGDNFSIATFGNDGFFNTLAVKLGDTDIAFNKDGKSSVSIETSRLVDGIDNVVTVLSNSVTLDRHVLSVRQPVRRPQILAEKTSDAWELTAIFTMQLDVSDHIWLSIDYGTAEPLKELYIPAVQREMRLVDSAIYSALGDYRVRVRLQNEISSAENTLDISVEVPITSLSAKTQNITSLQDEASFTFDVNMGGFPPQKVLFTIDYDDGNSTQVFYRNPDQNGFIPLNLRYQYKNWGIYWVKVTAANNISHVTENVLIHVGDNITFIDILTETERIAVGGTIEFLINCPTGSDVEYLVSFGDGTNLTVGELTGPEDSKHSNATVITESYIRVTHVFSTAGSYNAKVTVKNRFGSLSADLCPTLSVIDAVSVTSCPQPEVSFENMATSLGSPLVRKRSVDTLITVLAKFDCSQNVSSTKELTYSWKGVRLDIADGLNSTGNASLSDYVERTIGNYCAFKASVNTLTVKALDLPFGLYRLTVTVSPSDNDLVFTTLHLYIRIIQSEPVAVMGGEEFRTIMRYATAIFDISGSFDPDLEENVRLDLSYHLVFMPETALKKSKELSMQELLGQSDLLAERTLFPSTTSNRFAMYQQGSCFNDTDSPLTDLQAYNGKIKFHADSFSSEHYSFGVLLWVERNGLASSASQIAEVRSTNVSLDDLGSLLDLAMNADPDTAIRLCGGAASAILNQEASSADAQEELAKSTEAVVKTLGSVASRIDSPNQAATCASAIKTMTSNKDIVSEDSRSSAAGAFVNLANGTSQMTDATIDDASSFAGEALGGLGNIFPTAPEKSTAPKRRSSTPEESSTTTELLGLMASRMANDTDEFGYTTPFTTRATASTATTPTTTTTTTTTAPTTARTTTPTTTPYPTTTTQTVITTPTSTIIHTTVGTTLAPEVKATFVDNGDNFTISGITVATLRLNASDFSRTTYQPITTTTTAATTTTTEAQTTTPVTIPIHPMMFLPRHDPRTSWEIAEAILNNLPEKKTYDELLNYIFDDCLLFRKVMKTAEVQTNCPCISAGLFDKATYVTLTVTREHGRLGLYCPPQSKRSDVTFTACGEEFAKPLAGDSRDSNHAIHGGQRGRVVSASDSRSGGRGFDSRPCHIAVTLGKQFTLTFSTPPICKMGTQLQAILEFVIMRL